MALVHSISCDCNCGHLATASSDAMDRLVFKIIPKNPGDDIDLSTLPAGIAALLQKCQDNQGAVYLSAHCLTEYMATVAEQNTVPVPPTPSTPIVTPPQD